jgi:hypothetical protein
VPQQTTHLRCSKPTKVFCAFSRLERAVHLLYLADYELQKPAEDLTVTSLKRPRQNSSGSIRSNVCFPVPVAEERRALQLGGKVTAGFHFQRPASASASALGTSASRNNNGDQKGFVGTNASSGSWDGQQRLRPNTAGNARDKRTNLRTSSGDSGSLRRKPPPTSGGGSGIRAVMAMARSNTGHIGGF